MAYELQSVNLPTLTGNALRLFVKALETTWSGNMVAPGLLKQAGFETLRQYEAHSAPPLSSLTGIQAQDPPLDVRLGLRENCDDPSKRGGGPISPKNNPRL